MFGHKERITDTSSKWKVVKIDYSKAPLPFRKLCLTAVYFKWFRGMKNVSTKKKQNLLINAAIRINYCQRM